MRRGSARWLPAGLLLLVFFLVTSWEAGRELITETGTAQPASPGNLTLLDGHLLFQLPALEGGEVSSVASNGRVRLCFFWSTWCTPCCEQLTWLQELQDSYSGGEVVLVGLCLDHDGRAAAAYLSARQMNFPCGRVPEDLAARFDSLQGLPTLYLLTPEGVVYRKYEGLITRSQLEKDIAALLRTG